MPSGIPDCVDRKIPKTELSHCNRRLKRNFFRCVKKIGGREFLELRDVVESTDVVDMISVFRERLSFLKTERGMSVKEANMKMRELILLSFMYKFACENNRIDFKLHDFYKIIFKMSGNKYVSLWSGNEMTNIENWKKMCQTLLQEFSPSSRQYWCTRTFNETRNFPYFMNPELSLNQNERNWEKGTDGLKRGGKWMCNIMLFDETTLIRLYPDLFRPVEEMRQYIENEDTTKMRHSTYNVDKHPKKLVMYL